MLQIQDLRIGNKVKCSISNDHGVYTVLAIPSWWVDGICMDEPYVTIDRCPKETVPISKLKGWKLTAKTILEYGFQFDKITYSKGPIMLSEASKGFTVWYATLQFGKLIKPISYFHELQNIFFMLTGVELTQDKLIAA